MQKEINSDNDIYDITELEHEFEYSIYEDILKTEELMAELKQIDQAENDSNKIRYINFQNFPLEEFSEAGKVANEGDPHLKAAADNELYELEKRAIQMDMYDDREVNTNTHTDDNASNAEEYASSHKVSHVQQNDSEKGVYDNDNNILRKTVYGPTYVPFKEDGQKILLPQSTDMS